jgi:peptidoglycan/LPS O-acetylase OafA/YrhL
MNKKIIFFENIDGLRFFAFLPVFLRHSFYTEYDFIKNDWFYQFVSEFWLYGNLGVNFFFVLSGFLITFLLLQEQNINGKINIKAFYIRRTLRIWPLYMLTTVFGFFIFQQLKLLFGQTPNETASLLYYLTFLSNFDIINSGLPDSSVLSVLWSVSIEEQFYLFWPWILFLLKPKRYVFVFSLIIMVSLYFRYYNLDSHPHMLKYHTLSVISDMGLGGITAFLSFYNKSFIDFFKNLKKYKIAIVYVIGAIVIVYSNTIFAYPVLKVLKNLTLSLFFAFIILEQNYSENSLFKVNNWKTISHLGRWTYGLYCLHFIGILATTTVSKIVGLNDTVFGVVVIETLTALGVTILISYLSYTYFEKPFLKLKSRFSTIVQKKVSNDL